MRISDWSSDVCSSDLNPALSGADFLSHWRGKTSDDLASYIATNMPPGQPGLLTRKEYGALAAYILSSNGQKAPGRIAIGSESAEPAQLAAEKPNASTGDRDRKSTRLNSSH